MSDYQAGRIKKPRSFKINSKMEAHTKPRYVIGFDSEADTSSLGKPMLFQFSLPDMAEEDTICKVVEEDRKNAGLRVFLEFLDEHCSSREFSYLIYVWNLSYELTQIFHDLPDEAKTQDNLLIIPVADDRDFNWKIELTNGKRQIVHFKKGKNIGVTVLDGRAFYQTSLDGAAKMLGLGEKYTLGEGLSRSMFTRADLDNEEFLTYAKRDAYITRRIGEFISLQHDVWNINTTISAPHLATTVFRTHFLKTSMQSATIELEQAGLYSYHGGKNGFYLSEPSEFHHIYDYDITSAYPEAMRQLPDIDGARWRKYTYRGKVPKHGLCCVTGYYRRCKYRGAQAHSGRWLETGRVEGLWITSYEVQSLLDHGELDIEEMMVWEMIGPEGGALQEYVDHFFKQKQERSGPERETAKLMLNSLYGKFFQKQPVGDVGIYDMSTGLYVVENTGSDFDYEAGGLYHPPIASLITGFVRAKIHRLEHKYDAVMTSTDGFFGFVPPDPKDIGNGLGQLKVIEGRLRIWRERLYIFDGIDGKRTYALHGFRGSVKELEELIPLRKGKYTYWGKQMITLKMSNMSFAGEKYDPGTFARLEYGISI